MSQSEQKSGKFFERATSRRDFLKLSCKSAIGAAATFSVLGLFTGCSNNESDPYTILQQAKGVVVVDPTRCVGCRRCETVCTTYNDGKAQPAMARLRTGRNYNFGFQGAAVGFWRGEGEYGNFLVRPETCKQCSHPVPCQTACPQDAILADVDTGARIVDEEKCVGCGMCAASCPFAMINVDAESEKAIKCFLCDGEPKCVDNCPTGALKFEPWIDTTMLTPPRNFGNVIPIGKTFDENCGSCHK